MGTVAGVVALDTTLGEEDEFGLYEGYFLGGGGKTTAVRGCRRCFLVHVRVRVCTVHLRAWCCLDAEQAPEGVSYHSFRYWGDPQPRPSLHELRGVIMAGIELTKGLAGEPARVFEFVAQEAGAWYV